MTEKQARKEGLYFHGAYGHNKEEIKSKAAEIRKEGFKARVVDSTGGYSVYVEDAYFKTMHARQLIEKINSKEELIAEAKRKYEIELEKIQTSHDEAIDDLAICKAVLKSEGRDTKWITKELKQEN